MKLFTLEIKRVLRTKTTWLLLAASLALSGIMAWLLYGWSGTHRRIWAA